MNRTILIAQSCALSLLGGLLLLLAIPVAVAIGMICAALRYLQPKRKEP